MKSPFRYPGGKSKVQARLHKLAPDYREYREPFVGGGGMFFGVPADKTRWINDLDEHLIAVYLALRDRPAEFLRACRSIPVFDGTVVSKENLRAFFEGVAFDEAADQAVRYFFVNRTVWGGRVNYERRSRVYFSKPEGWVESALRTLEQAAGVMPGVKITCGDYERLLTEPGDDVWVYCDPPYVKDRLKSTSLLYRHNFETLPDHERLADAVRRSPHKVMVSYEDDPKGTVRSLYQGLNILAEEWTYVGTWSPDTDGVDKKRKGKELVITNYEVQKTE